MGNLSLNDYLAYPENVTFNGFNSINYYQRVTVVVNLPANQIQKHLSLRHPHLLQPISVHQNVLEYEIPPTSLASLIANRIPDNYFTESEILALVRGISSALAYLQENGICHGDITPESIFWDPTDSCYKILDNELVQGSNSGLQAFRSRKRAAYLSPQFILVARNEHRDPFPPNKYKNDVYSLGLCVLEMATFMAVSGCYDLHSLTANFPLADKFFLIFKQNYEIEFAHYLKIMINSEEVVRPDCWSLLRLMLNVGDGKLPIELNDGISPLSWCYLRQQFKKGRMRNASFGENPLPNMNMPQSQPSQPSQQQFMPPHQQHPSQHPPQHYPQPQMFASPRRRNNQSFREPQLSRYENRSYSQSNQIPNNQQMIFPVRQDDSHQPSLDNYGNPIFDPNHSPSQFRKGITEIKDFFNKSIPNNTTLELEKKIDSLLSESDTLIRKVLTEPSAYSKTKLNPEGKWTKNSGNSGNSKENDENKENSKKFDENGKKK